MVVTGGAGFIGVHSVEALLDAGVDVLVIDDLSHPSDRRLPAECAVEPRDIVSADARRVLAAFRPHAVLHLAAQGGVNRSWRDPAMDARINVEGTASVLHAASQAGCARVVIASSGGALYGAAETLPTPEDVAATPRSPYGTAKLAAERYLELFGRRGAFSALALRYGNVYGPGQDGSGEAGVVAITSARLVSGLPPRVRGDGEQTRDFVHVGDVARANLAALGCDATGAVNVGTGSETSVNQVIASLSRAAGYGGDLVREPMPPGEVRRSCLDVSRAAELLRWRPRVELDAGLAATYRHFQRRGA